MNFPLRYPSERAGGAPADKSEHFIKCGTSGGWIDCRDLEQVFAHEEPNHKPESVS